MIRVVLPAHLRSLAGVSSELSLDVADPPTIGGVLDALESAHPMLRGTLREHGGGARRPFVRFYACEEDLSHEPADSLLSAEVVSGKEPFLVVGAMAGG
ncbi:MAG: MoaD/ThiS family protein [Geodermatophilaceae bacterium]|nr:MoaD/ThiS family protein [Geodermatophilaceae bacterium]MDQ3454346.1 MoaD/ThiS family protein [Actinomycetota bacterium]